MPMFMKHIYFNMLNGNDNESDDAHISNDRIHIKLKPITYNALKLIYTAVFYSWNLYTQLSFIYEILC